VDEVDRRWAVADPSLIVDLLGTLRREQREMVDELADERRCVAWLRRRLPHIEITARPRDRLVGLREQARTLLTAAVTGDPLPADVVTDLSRRAAQAPVTLAARIRPDGSPVVERVSRGHPRAAVDAEFARSALVLLDGPDRHRLRRCRAPECILFFLQQDPRQHWCSPGCGNRARVARHRSRPKP
jgi:predicted RNA-binding Zn ribbon-like protein